MRIALVNQTFYPDVVSSGQHLTDLALRLAERGHEVIVVTSRRAYDDPGKVFPKQETWRGVRILRVFTTGFGKRAKWRRAADFASFLGSCCWRLLRLPRQDLVVAMTSPPLVSFIGAWFARLRGSRFCYWIMDLNPDEALAAGWLAPESFAARSLEWCSRFSLRNASKIVVLDHFMQQRILEKEIEPRKIAVIPPWSHDSDVRFDAEGRNRFRKLHGLEDRFVVMYSGNHSPCHPLDTILNAAKQLAENREVAFLFVGGGSQFAKVRQFAIENSLSNIQCLPYQPMNQLAGALSAADLHLVVMGNPFVGLVHPCKIYNILRVGSPVLYIGPQPSHISEILDELNGQLPCGWAEHGQVERVIQHILDFKKAMSQRKGEQCVPFADRFSKEALLPRLVATLESAVGSGEL
jgi:colanic acid biosynthesis glycosyl transferase WcaI